MLVSTASTSLHNFLFVLIIFCLYFFICVLTNSVEEEVFQSIMNIICKREREVDTNGLLIG